MTISVTAPFAAPYAPADETLVPDLIDRVVRSDAAEARIDERATKLVKGIRKQAGSVGGLEDFLRDYGLSTREGLALMVMAEALLRVPDAATQDALIADKIGAGDWGHMEPADTWFVSAATWGLGVSNRIVKPGDTPNGLLAGMTKRIGAPAVRQGVRQAMRFLGHQFVLGETIGEALKRARGLESKGYRHSYDMLGEGARTWDDARRYTKSYADAITAIGRAAGNKPLPDRPGISVKLSALHPRYEARNREAVLAESVPRPAGTGAGGEVLRPQSHGRCRGAEPARIVARRDRARFRRPLPARLGRVRPCHSGLCETSPAGHRLDRRSGGNPRRAHDGAAGQGCLLGRRGETRAGGRGRRLPCLHPQTGHRCLLPRLRRADAGTARHSGQIRHLPADRHPQRTHRRHRHRDGGRDRRQNGFRIPAPARHGRGIVRTGQRETVRRGRRAVPHLRTRRRPQGSAGLSRAATAGERGELLLRRSRGRHRRADRRTAGTPCPPAGQRPAAPEDRTIPAPVCAAGKLEGHRIWLTPRA